LAFQKAAGLTPDGIVGPKTWGQLHAGGVKIPTPAKGGGMRAQQMTALAAKLKTVEQLMQSLKTRQASPGALAAGQAALPKPSLHHGWLDDAADWAEEQVDSATDWVEEQVDAVTEGAGAAADWVEDQVDAAVDTATTVAGDVAAGAGAAADWAGNTTDEAVAALEEMASGAVESIQAGFAALEETAGEVLGDAKEIFDQVIGDLGRGFGPDFDFGDIDKKLNELIGKLEEQASNAVTKIDPTQSSTKVTKANATNEISAANLVEVANKLGGHAGSVTRSVDALDLLFFEDDPTKTVVKANIEISLTKTMPKWKEYDEQCDPVKKEWDRFFAALDKHENNHLAKFLSIYTPSMHSPLLGKPEPDANALFEAADKKALQINTDYDAATANGMNETPSTKINPISCELEKVK
jgi:peptidoglycan hydrolase-like protein with peptidoglycan-binding domain